MSRDGGCLPINPESLAAPRGYANGMLAPAGGRLLFVAGQVAWDQQARIVSSSFTEQFSQALGNVLEVVKVAGGEPGDVAQLTIFVVDKAAYLAALKEVGGVYRSLMGKHYPAMALVEVRALVEEGAQVEIQAIAVLPAIPGDSGERSQ